MSWTGAPVGERWRWGERAMSGRGGIGGSFADAREADLEWVAEIAWVVWAEWRRFRGRCKLLAWLLARCTEVHSSNGAPLANGVPLCKMRNAKYAKTTLDSYRPVLSVPPYTTAYKIPSRIVPVLYLPYPAALLSRTFER